MPSVSRLSARRPLFAGVVAHDQRRGPGRRGRAQRQRQVDAAADPRRGAAARCRRRAPWSWGPGRRAGPAAGAPTGTVRDAVGEGWQGEAMLDRLGMARSARCVDRASCRAASASGWPWRRCWARVGRADPRRADQPPRSRCHRLPRGVAGRLHRRAGARHPRSPRAGPGHDQGARDRPRRGLPARCRPAGTRDRATPRTSPAGPSARSSRPRREQVRRNLARRELAWLRRGAPARSTQAQGARRRGHGRRRRARPGCGPRRRRSTCARQPAAGLEGHRAPRGRLCLAGRHAGCIDPFDCRLEPGDRLGVVGPNGAGKCTLLDLIAGRLQPIDGTVERGRTVHVGYYDQLGRDLDLGAAGARGRRRRQGRAVARRHRR